MPKMVVVMGVEEVGPNQSLMILTGKIQREEMEYVSIVNTLVTLQGNVLLIGPQTQRNMFSIIMPMLQLKMCLTSPLHNFQLLMISLFSCLLKVTRHIAIKNGPHIFSVSKDVPKEFQTVDGYISNDY